MSRLIVVGVASLAFGFAGCGGSDSGQSEGQSDRDQIESLALQFFDSIQNGDYEKGCEVFSPKAIKRFEEAVGSCEAVLKLANEQFSEQDFAQARDIKAIEVNGNTATLKTANKGADAELEKVGDQWYFSG